ncbi:MAG: glycosyltransferase family 4 protein [Prevotella sp.]|nr:glycosyltransferase family 4 protein [Prevotella sp.]
MHILEIPSFFTPYGGEFCLEQAKALAARGHEVRIMACVQLSVRRSLRQFITLPWLVREEQYDGVTVMKHYMRGWPRSPRKNQRRWVNTVQRMYEGYVRRYGRPDIIHAHCAKWAGYAALLIHQRHGVPYAITEHLSLHVLEQEWGSSTTTWQVPLLRQAYEGAGIVIPVAREVVEQTAHLFGTDYRWQEVSNIIDTDFFAYRPRATMTPYRFCCIAHNTPLKGYDILFDAFAKVHGTYPKSELHVAGRDTHLLSKPEGVVVHGELGRDDLRQLLYDCHCLVLASRSEVQPLVVLEAVSTGRPVIGTTCIPQNERIEGAVSIVPVDDTPALTQAMLHQVENDIVGATGQSYRLAGEQVATLAAPSVVAQQLERLFVALQ